MSHLHLGLKALFNLAFQFVNQRLLTLKLLLTFLDPCALEGFTLCLVLTLVSLKFSEQSRLLGDLFLEVFFDLSEPSLRTIKLLRLFVQL